MRQLSLIISIILSVSTTFCRASDAKYSGEWLASALDMNTPDKAHEAMRLDNLNGAASSNLDAKPIDQNDFVNKRIPYMKLVESGNYNEALSIIDNSIKDVTITKTDSSKDVINLELLFLVFDKLQVLRRANRSIEASIEAQKLLYSMKKMGICHPKSSHNRLCLSLNKFISQTEAQLSISDDYHKLQLQTGASSSDVKKSYRNLMLILHPDKYLDVDEEGQAYLYELYFKVRGAFDTLKSN